MRLSQQLVVVLWCALCVADSMGFSRSTLPLLLAPPARTTKTTRRTAAAAVVLSMTTNDQQQEEGRADETSAPTPITTNKVQPDILLPFAPAADPNYMNVGPVGEGDFVVSRTGGPTPEELTNENIRKIVELQCSDLEVNTLIWKCLGYRFDETLQSWKNDNVFPNWRERYPTPPDLIGMRRIYEKEVDQPSLRSNQSLVRSIPVEHKLSLKKHLRPLGWRGYQYAELTPNKTRRAQCANWIVFFREELYGKSVEELKAAREAKKAAEQAAKQVGQAEEWKPPVREVF